MRFFHKFKTINYEFTGLVNGIIIKCKKKKKYTKALEYFSKYSYILDNIKIAETSDKFTDKIWQLWLQGEENMPAIVKKCTNTVKIYHKNNVILLTKENLKEYIQFPDYIEEKYKKGIITHANYSDLIRLTLLAKYGGCWVDSTIYLTDFIPEDILKSDFFAFKSLDSENLKFIKTLEQFKIFSNANNKVISFESPYFLCAKAGNILINAVLQLFLEYWKHEDKLADYLMIDKMFVLAILCNDKCKQEFLKMPTYYLDNVLLLQRTLFEKYDATLFNNIKNLTPVHKLTHKNLHRNPYKDSFLMHILEK